MATYTFQIAKKHGIGVSPWTHIDVDMFEDGVMIAERYRVDIAEMREHLRNDPTAILFVAAIDAMRPGLTRAQVNAAFDEYQI